MRVLVTGGAGYIGSHTCVDLLQRGHEVVIVDNLSNSSPDVARKIEDITGKPVSFHLADVRDQAQLARALVHDNIEAVLHFAALKSVGESWSRPLDYYDHNVHGTLSLLRAMSAAEVRTLVFSSSATVYGETSALPLTENSPTGTTNPYARTKLMCEEIIADHQRSAPGFNAAILRYFNPVGAHASGMIGEQPTGIPNNLMPYIAQVAAGSLECLEVFGGDYPTPDGTGVRDYIHVSDLARAHVDALEYLACRGVGITINLGTGNGHSVLEVIKAFERACGRTIRHRIVGRRPGDVASSYADPSLANQLLGWKAELDLDRMCRDAWRWQAHRASS